MDKIEVLDSIKFEVGWMMIFSFIVSDNLTLCVS